MNSGHTESCSTCRCWRILPNELQTSGQPKKGLCLLNPPALFMIEGEEKKRLFAQQHPQMTEGAWCGQWSSR